MKKLLTFYLGRITNIDTINHYGIIHNSELKGGNYG